jgi:hypothetical protein
MRTPPKANFIADETTLVELEQKLTDQRDKLLIRSVKNQEMSEAQAEAFEWTLKRMDRIEAELTQEDLGEAWGIARRMAVNAREPHLPPLYDSVPFIGLMLPKETLDRIERYGAHLYRKSRVADYDKIESLQRQIFAVQKLRRSNAARSRNSRP